MIKRHYLKYGQAAFLGLLTVWFVPCAGAFIIDPDVTPWLSTASGDRARNGSGGTLTWSIVPDGTPVSDGFDDLGNSDLVAFMNDHFGGDTLQDDHSSQPWFSIFERSFDRWAELSGLSFVYEPNDDGVSHGDPPGVLGVRGDIRISGASIDGRGDTLAFNYLPEFGGDMVLDTDEVSFTRSSRGHLFLRNTVMHELGHAFGLSHVRSDSDRLLMEAFTDTTIEGPQLDDIRGVQYYFGDVFESENDGLGNETVSTASYLGSLPVGASIVIGEDGDIVSQTVRAEADDFVSISNGEDRDIYSFTVAQHADLTAELTPLGGTFVQAAEFGRPRSFNASARTNLSLAILDSDGRTILADADESFAGEPELISPIRMRPGTYFARVEGDDQDSIQLYMLDLSLAEVIGDCNGDGVVDSNDLRCACAGGVAKVLVELKVPVGDLNADGSVNFDDFVQMSQNFGAEGEYASGDLDCNGHVQFEDFVILSNQFRPRRRRAGASVPEPECQWNLAIAVLAASFVMRRVADRSAGRSAPIALQSAI